jgi:hypothetical protein
MKQIPDSEILLSVLHRILGQGQRAATFSAISAATGLSASALVLRFGSQPMMCQTALRAGWAELILRAAPDLATAKGLQDYLKHQSEFADIPAMLTQSLSDKTTLAAATEWRGIVESTLARHFGGGMRGRHAAGLTFAAWQGRLAWAEAGGKSFRLGELIRGLS